MRTAPVASSSEPARRMVTATLAALAVAAMLGPAITLGQAAVPAPRLLPYQGRLLKADGTPETGTRVLGFRIYDAVTGGNTLWAEAQGVPLTNGFYAVFLGSVSAFPDGLFDGHDRWLGVSVDDGGELAPRQQIASVAYAFTATNALRAASADQATSAIRAATATSADRAASADYSTNAGHATQADTATITARADHASTADSATNATNVTGGAVSATTITASGGINATTVIPAAAGQVAASSIRTTGDAVIGGDLTLTGALNGGGFRVIGVSNSEFNDTSTVPLHCRAYGAATCGDDGLSPGCTAGETIETFGAHCWVGGFGEGYCHQFLCIAQ